MTNKRQIIDGNAESASKKVRKLPFPDHEGLLKDLQPLCTKLDDLEKECVKELATIQKVFRDKMAPIYEERDKILSSSKGLWANLIAHCPGINERACVVPMEMDLLNNHLVSLKVNDDLDENGSYEVIMTFDTDSSKNVFSPAVWRKKVIYTSDGAVDETQQEFTEITFVDSKEDPREILKMTCNKREEVPKATDKGEEKDDDDEMDDDDDDEDDDDDDDDEPCLVEWFSSSKIGSFGELTRALIYPKPADVIFEANACAEEEENDAQAGEDGKEQKQQ